MNTGNTDVTFSASQRHSASQFCRACFSTPLSSGVLTHTLTRLKLLCGLQVHRIELDQFQDRSRRPVQSVTSGRESASEIAPSQWSTGSWVRHCCVIRHSTTFGIAGRAQCKPEHSRPGRPHLRMHADRQVN